jgi:hypothetical protein
MGREGERGGGRARVRENLPVIDMMKGDTQMTQATE